MNILDSLSFLKTTGNSPLGGAPSAGQNIVGPGMGYGPTAGGGVSGLPPDLVEHMKQKRLQDALLKFGTSVMAASGRGANLGTAVMQGAQVAAAGSGGSDIMEVLQMETVPEARKGRQDARVQTREDDALWEEMLPGGGTPEVAPGAAALIPGAGPGAAGDPRSVQLASAAGYSPGGPVAAPGAVPGPGGPGSAVPEKTGLAKYMPLDLAKVLGRENSLAWIAKNYGKDPAKREIKAGADKYLRYVDSAERVFPDVVAPASEDPTDPILGKNQRGYAYQLYKKYQLQEGPLNREEEGDYNAARAILNQPYIVSTSEGVKTFEGLGLPDRGVAGDQVAGGAGDPEFTGAKVSAEQAGRVAWVPRAQQYLKELRVAVNSDEYTRAYIEDYVGLPAFLQTEAGRDLTVGKSQVNELVLRIMTGAAAPTDEVARMGRWLDLPPGARPAEVERRITVIEKFLGDYQRLADPGGRLTPEQWNEITPEYADAIKVATPEEAAGLPSGTHIEMPDGTFGKVP